MGTENTAGVILQGAQLNTEATKAAQSAITAGFGMMQSSIRDSASIYNGMIQSLNDVRRTEIDEWYKGEQIKLDKDRLAVDKSYKEGSIANDAARIKVAKDEADRRKDEADKFKLTAPIVSAFKINLTDINNQKKEVINEINKLQYKIQGLDSSGKEKERAGLYPGSPEYRKAKEGIDFLQNQLNELNSMEGNFSTGLRELSLGGDPLTIKEQYFPSNNNQQQESSQDKFGTGVNNRNPLLPNLPGVNESDIQEAGPETTFNNKNTSNYVEANKANKFPEARFNGISKIPVSPESGISYRPTMTDNHTYRSLDQHFQETAGLISDTTKGKPYRLDIARESLSQLSLKDQEEIIDRSNGVYRSSYLTVGSEIARERLNRDYKSRADYFTKLNKDNMLGLGVDPSKVDAAVIRASIDLDFYQNTKEFRDIPEDQQLSAMIAFLAKRTDSIINEGKEQEKPKSAIDKAKGAYEIDTSAFNPDGSLRLQSVEDTSSKKIDAQFQSYRDQFSKFTTNINGRYAVNNDFVSWINSLSSKDLGINDLMPIQNPTTYEVGYTKKPKEQLAREELSRKREIVNDPERAFYFWLDKYHKITPEQLPSSIRDGFNRYKKEKIQGN